MKPKSTARLTFPLATAFAALALMLAPTLQAATLTATTDLIGGTPIPTDVGSFDETDNTAPYVYNIDDDPATVTLQTQVDFDMGDFNLNNTGDNTHDVTINAASLSYSGVGGAFGFSAGSARPDLTINVTGALAVRSVTTYANTGNGNKPGGAIRLTAPNGIAVLNGLSSGARGNNNAAAGLITLTSTGGAGTGFIQIGGAINSASTNASAGNGGAVTLTAANGINLSAGINTLSGARTGGAINIDGGTGPVSITGPITANGTTDGILSITSGDTITLSSQLNLELINTLTLTAPNVFLNGGVSGAEGLTKTGTGIWTIAGTSTYTGNTTISGGTLALGANDVLPDASNVSIGSATLNAATFDDTAGTLGVTGAATINFGTGANLAFLDSSSVDWTGGTLNVSGAFVSGSSLRFGTTADGLTAGQIAQISAPEFSSLSLDENGYLTATYTGTPPTISDIADQSALSGYTTVPATFTVGDAETAPGVLTVTGSSDNPTLVPDGNIVFGGSGADRTVTVTSVSGETGSATITVTVSDGIASASDTFVLTVGPNTAPSISDIADQEVPANGSTGELAFTVGDAETDPGSLTLTGSSSNTTLVPNNNIVFDGSGASRTVTVTPAAGKTGSATITVTVSDGLLSASDTFVITVPNTAPTISDIADKEVPADGSTGPLAFTVGDAETDSGSLSVSGSSENTTLVPNGNIVFGGSGADRTVTVTPASGESGSATITVTVSDGDLSASDTFVLAVTSGSPYDTWADGFLPADVSDPVGNNDGDSLTNLQEFAFGTDPTVSTGQIVYAGGTLTTPGAPKIVEAGGIYSIVFGQLADPVAAGLTYTVQFSAGLDTWVDNNDGTNPPVQVATDGTIDAMSVPFVDFITTPSGTQKPTFARVKVETAP